MQYDFTKYKDEINKKINDLRMECDITEKIILGLPEEFSIFQFNYYIPKSQIVGTDGVTHFECKGIRKAISILKTINGLSHLAKVNDGTTQIIPVDGIKDVSRYKSVIPLTLPFYLVVNGYHHGASMHLCCFYNIKDLGFIEVWITIKNDEEEPDPGAFYHVWDDKHGVECSRHGLYPDISSVFPNTVLFYGNTMYALPRYVKCVNQ